MSQAKELKILKIASNKNLSDNSIRLLTKNCTEIRNISLTDCERISDASMKFFAGCKNLMVLNLADCIRFVKF